jgi:outer membrane lipoprotein-sorting protein
MPVQQKLQEPNGNYLLVKFSAEKLNPRISETQFDAKLPKGVEIQQIK